MGSNCSNTVESSMTILEKNSHIPGAKETVDKLKQFVGKPTTNIVDTLKISNDQDDMKFHVLGHGYKLSNKLKCFA